MILLTDITHPAKGESWPIEGVTLTVGRGADCDIVVGDPAASRRHCEIRSLDGSLHLVDLGSANVTLVNGEPVQERALSIGDTVSVGNTMFLVTSTGRTGRITSMGSVEKETVAISVHDAIYLRRDPDTLLALERPRTVHELTWLFELARELSEVAAVQDYVGVLRRHLETRMGSCSAWIYRCLRDEERLSLLAPQEAPASGAEEPLLALLERAVSEQRAILMPEERKRRKKGLTHLAAPMTVSGESVGAIGLTFRGSQTGLDGGSLHYLMAVAHQAAPFLINVQRAERQQLDIEQLRAKSGESVLLVGTSRAMGHVRGLIRKAAPTDLSILIVGETGTGKELSARMVHDFSTRSNAPCVCVNCAAVPHELFESEFFGFEKGAFTGAERPKIGLVEQANGGTLFLDEVSDLSLANQARILRVIEGGSFYRIGGEHEINVDIRVVSATNKDLASAVADGSFREDLFHRLNGIEIQIPPLRKRPSDIPTLAEHFLSLGRGQSQHPIRGFDQEAIEFLKVRPWSGNVRELRNAIYRAIAMTHNEIIMVSDLGVADDSIRGGAPTVPMTLAQAEQQHIELVLRDAGGNVSAAARLLGISRNTLYNKMAQYGLTR